jgi:hypothetical protein
MSNSKAIKFEPKTPSDALALEIAKSFGDEIRLPLYRQICAAHNHSNVYRAFKDALRTPIHKIKKSRRALLIYLLRKYEPKD